eukprot:258032-Alexandrium_andersonii.AAC.1
MFRMFRMFRICKTHMRNCTHEHVALFRPSLAQAFAPLSLPRVSPPGSLDAAASLATSSSSGLGER